MAVQTRNGLFVIRPPEGMALTRAAMRIDPGQTVKCKKPNTKGDLLCDSIHVSYPEEVTR